MLLSLQLTLALSDEGGALVHGMGVSELALALQCLHALGVTWRTITTDSTSGSLGVVALREYMIRVYHTALLDTRQNKGLDNGMEKDSDEETLFLMGEGREARTLRQAMVAIGTKHAHVHAVIINAAN